MRGRCRHHPTYAGRVSICPEWNDYFVFEQDMGPHPGKGWTLDRKENDKGYSKDNCRWATRRTQAQNRRGQLDVSVVIKIRERFNSGERQSKLVTDLGISSSQISRIVRGLIWRP